MRHEKFKMQVQGSLPNSELITYIQESYEIMMIDKRPLVLICPGGGYLTTCDREAESVALQFLAMGYHAAVLRYSCAPARYPTALLELAFSVALIRKHADEWRVDEDKIFVLGFSAGGHLAASLGVSWHEKFLAESLGLALSEQDLICPNGMILCYPVITSGEFANRDSFENLLGSVEEYLDTKQREVLLEKNSLEKHVSERTSRAFIWHTFTDQGVPVENSLLLVSALRKAGVPTEFHMYSKGVHGVALGNHLTAAVGGEYVQEECASWIELVHTWIESFKEERKKL